MDAKNWKSYWRWVIRKKSFARSRGVGVWPTFGKSMEPRLDAKRTFKTLEVKDNCHAFTMAGNHAEATSPFA